MDADKVRRKRLEECKYEWELIKSSREALKTDFGRIYDRFQQLNDQGIQLDLETEELRARRLEMSQEEYEEKWKDLYDKRIVLKEMTHSLVEIASKIHKQSEALMRDGEDCLMTLSKLEKEERSKEK